MEIESEKLVGGIAVLALIISIISFFASFATRGEWACVRSECVRWVEGEEWVKHFCYQNETSKEMFCNVILNDQPLIVPLSMINISSVRSCAETRCVQEVLTRRV